MERSIIAALLLLTSSTALAGNTWQTYNDKMVALYQEKNYQEALIYAEKALNYAIKKTGQDSAITLTSQNNIAKLYQLNQEWDKAQTLFESTLQSREKLLGKTHKETMISRHNLAKLHLEIKAYDKASALLAESLELNIKRSATQRTLIDDVRLLQSAWQSQQAQAQSRIKELEAALQQHQESLASQTQSNSQALAEQKQQCEQSTIELNNQTESLVAKIQELAQLQASLRQLEQDRQQCQADLVEQKNRNAGLAAQPPAAQTLTPLPDDSMSKKACFKLQEKVLDQITACQTQKAQIQQALEQIKPAKAE